MHAYNGVLTVLGLACFFCILCFVSVKVKRTVLLLCVCVHSAWKGRPEVTYTVLSGMLNPTHSLTLLFTTILTFMSEIVHFFQRYAS